MTTTSEMNERTREEWRDLGFFYDYDREGSRWRLVGSREGLLRFVEILELYASDPRNQGLSEHKHYGPYLYLKLLTWETADIGEGAIYGTLSDCKRLSAIVKRKLDSSQVGSEFTIGDEYAVGTINIIQFEVCKEGFDPASAYPLLSHAS
jgi:hypothetical protein